MLFIEVFYHFSPYKDFKHYYLYGICHEHRDKFKKLPCYQRFISLKKQLFMPMSILLYSLMGEETGIYFADSTTLKLCHNNHKVGLKLHLIINHKGEIMAVKITPGNTDDRKALEEIVHVLQGKCYADKGCIGKDIFKNLWEKRITSHYWNSQKHEKIPHAVYR